LKLKVCDLSKITLECCFVFRISTTSCRTYWFFVPNSWVSWLWRSHLIRLRLYPRSVYPIFLQDILEGFHYLSSYFKGWSCRGPPSSHDLRVCFSLLHHRCLPQISHCMFSNPPGPLDHCLRALFVVLNH
jgi:hypothetical protein